MLSILGSMFSAVVCAFKKVAHAVDQAGPWPGVHAISPMALATLMLLLPGQQPAWGQQVAAGGYHSAALYPDGTLWAWGGNDRGQLGDGTVIYRSVPVRVGAATWQSLSAGYEHTAAVRADGTLWAWGGNRYAQLGDGTSSGRNAPVQVGTATDWRSVSCGSYYTLAVRTNGTLWAWGDNTWGQLGDGTALQRTQPVQIGTAANWRSADAGFDHASAVRTDGTLWAWGSNGYGQLGDGTYTGRNVPVQIGTATNWRNVSAGHLYNLAVRADGTLWAWGMGRYGQLGDGGLASIANAPQRVGTATDWVTAEAGTDHSMAVRANGALWTWGSNGYGQLGDGLPNQQIRALPAQAGTVTTWRGLAAGDAHAVAFRADGSIWAWGDNGYGAVGSPATEPGFHVFPTQVGGGATWQSGSAGSYYCLAVRTNGTLWGWGNNADGQLGNGTTAQQATPAPIGTANNWLLTSASHVSVLAVRTDGTLWGWGKNQYGELGDGTTTPRLAPVRIGTGSNWQRVSTNTYHTLAVRTDGTLWSWGSNAGGELGDGTTAAHYQPQQVGTATDWQSVHAGGGYSVALRSNGSMWSWGNFGAGPQPTPQPTPQPAGQGVPWLMVDVGATHNVGVRTDGTLWAWGSNNFGQLGDGTTTYRPAPVQIGSATSWRSASAGGTFYPTSAALRTDGSLWAWGHNVFGQLGDGTTVSRTTPGQVGTDNNWRNVDVGFNHLVAVRTDGSLWRWGENRFGIYSHTSGQHYKAYVPMLVYQPTSTPLSTKREAGYLHVAPNPAREEVVVLGVESNTSLRLLDLQGRLVRTSTGARLSVRSVAPGLYLLQAVTRGHPLRTTRLAVE